METNNKLLSDEKIARVQRSNRLVMISFNKLSLLPLKEREEEKASECGGYQHQSLERGLDCWRLDRNGV